MHSVSHSFTSSVWLSLTSSHNRRKFEDGRPFICNALPFLDHQWNITVELGKLDHPDITVRLYHLWYMHSGQCDVILCDLIHEVSYGCTSHIYGHSELTIIPLTIKYEWIGFMSSVLGCLISIFWHWYDAADVSGIYWWNIPHLIFL